MIGYLIGAGSGILVPEMHRIKSPRINLSTFANGQSGGLKLTWNLGVKQTKPLHTLASLLHTTE